jgi:hypothetical protein
VVNTPKQTGGKEKGEEEGMKRIEEGAKGDNEQRTSRGSQTHVLH